MNIQPPLLQQRHCENSFEACSDSPSDAWGRRDSCLVFLAFPIKRETVSFIPNLPNVSVERVYAEFSSETFHIGLQIRFASTVTGIAYLGFSRSRPRASLFTGFLSKKETH
ncbi:dual specificity protein phosphatase 14 isoform X2 [Heterocephalus glaber]|uniref:Dual specificity protein phosphatase 14 isoform X2 n=1 Tax=Heterocephalus glaber TaxID=10181 RepID=A0AAX6S7I8_HETGA|nr:dual specificity protein phosphatase 14 isoform X2 [Heterocephalus glaber]XP_021104389.1 dual specificity protein phosphatase 14 isoform X2 [Heterocephalus glaber]XP_021104390.1 dual specificity protein phosphatase 14 isoform X2 [Heterocephalus glaber]XP_021104391.1 dual specificity protein phosphatase 14 isoform X2 [Heterocephalus glaber]